MTASTVETVPTVDPEFKALIPALLPDELAGLEASIARDGCLAPLVVWRGTLLDGHHRLDICRRLGKAFGTIEIDLPDREAALLWIEEHQLNRRNLPDDVRAVVALSVLRRRSEIARRERAAKAGETGGRNHPKDASLSVNASDKLKTDTRAAVAREAKIPERKLRAAAEVAKADPKLLEEVRDGTKSLAKARREARKQDHETLATAGRAEPKPADDPEPDPLTRLIPPPSEDDMRRAIYTGGVIPPEEFNEVNAVLAYLDNATVSIECGFSRWSDTSKEQVVGAARAVLKALDTAGGNL